MSTRNQVLVVDDEADIRELLGMTLTRMGLETHCAASTVEAFELLARHAYDLCLTDMRLPDGNGLSLVEHIAAHHPDTPVAMMTAYGNVEAAVAALKAGAFDFVTKPVDLAVLRQLVTHALNLGVQRRAAVQAVGPRLLGDSPAMQRLRELAARVARSQAPVFICGESGTGKELVAHALHRHSPRAQKPFIALNMAAIPKDLMESELFGHERGAFTGAQNRRYGRFEQADGGALFLDEIGDMPAELQTRLLRVLADGEFYRVGGHEPIKVDVRIIAATHQNLEKLVGEGRFREDLFHRLNVIRIHLPALRERREDIPLLINHFLVEAAQELGGEVKRLLPETVAELQRLDWPGNVRQLENTARWLTVMASGQEVHIEDLPPELRQTRSRPEGAGDWGASLRGWARRQLGQGRENLLEQALPQFETILIETALEHTAGRRQEAAKLLGWGRNTLTRKIKELGLALGDDED